MKEDIETFKERNGNRDFTQKEILMGLTTKVERIEERLSKGEHVFGQIQGICKTRGEWLKYSLPTGFSILLGMSGGLLYLILHLHGVW